MDSSSSEVGLSGMAGVEVREAETGWRGGVVAVLICASVAAAAVVGASFTPGAWYEELTKPPGTPPNWLFGPVWSCLYLMIAVAGVMLWRVRGQSRRPFALWCAQLVLNAVWSWLFFGLHQMGLAAVEITVLWATILILILDAWTIRRAASMLLLPYLAWVGYATYLSLSFWASNGLR